MDELHGVDVTLFPRSGKRSVKIHADVDSSLPFNLLQKVVLDRLQLPYTACQAPQLKDGKGRSHTPIGQVELVWHKTKLLIEHAETFYVVESGHPDVMLKGICKDGLTDARPLMNGAQSAEEAERQAQRKAEAEKKRAEEEQKRVADREKQQDQASGK